MVTKLIDYISRKLDPPDGPSRPLSVGMLRRMLTGRGTMRMTDDEVDDLVKRICPGSCSDRWWIQYFQTFLPAAQYNVLPSSSSCLLTTSVQRQASHRHVNIENSKVELKKVETSYCRTDIGVQT